jgi:hypothetical protein
MVSFASGSESAANEIQVMIISILRCDIENDNRNFLEEIA